MNCARKESPVDKAYRTPDGRIVIVASDPMEISVAEQQQRGMRPNGFPENFPENLGVETILTAYKRCA